MTFTWKTNTTPMRALNRRKFADMVGREKEGREVRSCAWGASVREDGRSSTGMTCCNSLDLCQQPAREDRRILAHFSSIRSCMLEPVERRFSFKLFPCRLRISLFRPGLERPSPSSERSSSWPNDRTGIGSSRFAKASTVNSSMAGFWYDGQMRDLWCGVMAEGERCSGYGTNHT
jgi:hypothetical protein